MDTVEVSKEEIQSLFREANDFIAIFEGFIKHLQKRIDNIEKKIEATKDDPVAVETYTRLLSEGKK